VVTGRPDSDGLGEAEADAERRLAPWRGIGVAISIAQLVGLFALVATIFLLRISTTVPAYAIAGAIIVLELGQWGLARAALRSVPSFDPLQHYALRPLEDGHRRIVELNLMTTVIAVVLFGLQLPTTSFKHDRIAVLLLLAVGLAPGFLALWRVRRHNSWLAISRIPAKPSQPKSSR
jgi:hypothetical protein